MLELNNSKLKKSFSGTTVFENITFDIKTNERLGLIGPNGCGKTTLLKIINKDDTPDTGSVQLHLKSITSYNKRELAQELALVPQEYDTGFGFSVEEVVLMGRHPHIPRFASPSDHDWKQVDQAMDAIGISDLRERYTATLSGGQKQRTVVARALAQDTALLLFDEATSSLDIKYTLQIFNLVKTLVEQQNRTVIAVMHNLNLAAAYCDELLIMDNGTIAHSGATEDVLTTGTIKEVFGVESTIVWDEYNQTKQVNFHYKQEL